MGNGQPKSERGRAIPWSRIGNDDRERGRELVDRQEEAAANVSYLSDILHFRRTLSRLHVQSASLASLESVTHIDADKNDSVNVHTYARLNALTGNARKTRALIFKSGYPR